MKNFININDCTIEEFNELITLGLELKRKLKAGESHEYLKGKTLGMIFTKSSTRTRVSFEVGMYQLGGYALYLNSNDIQLGRGETISDTAKVLSRFIDGIMIRTYAQKDVEDLAQFGSIPIINGLTDLMHPCQIVADLMTIQEVKGKLKGLKLAYIGDGNNVANSLLQGCAMVGMNISIASPSGYECDSEIIGQAKATAAITGSEILLFEDPEEAVKDADIVYTDTWGSMGEEADAEIKKQVFRGYQVNAKLFSKAKPDAMFLHDLPAYRGYEVTDEIIDGPASYVFDEAENRLHAQKAVMVTLLA